MSIEAQGTASVNPAELTIRQWNDCLYAHYFMSGNGNVQSPVTRLPVNGDELAVAAGCHRRDAEEARRAFVACLKNGLEGRSFATDAMHKFNVWKRRPEGVPLCLSHLLLTCMVVNDLAEELRDVGDFRKRLTAILGGGRHQNLSALRLLWENFAAWTSSQELLNQSRAERLVLPEIPESGRFSHIGYSLRLSVPSRRDQEALRTLLISENSYGRELEVQKIVRAIARSFGKFSPEFQELYSAFTLMRKQLPDSALTQSTFWSLVRAVSLSGGKKSETGNTTRIRLELEDDDGHFWLTLCSDRSFAIGSLRTIPSTKGDAGPFPYVVTVENGYAPFSTLLSLGDDFDQSQLREASDPIRKAITAGILLFEESDDRVSVLTTTLPTSGKLKALLSQIPNQDLRLALRDIRPSPQTSRSIYKGWTEWRDLSAEVLRSREVSLYPSLAAADCLRPVLSPVNVVIRDGVRIGASFLTLESCLPTFHVQGSDKCELQYPDGSARGLQSLGDGGWFIGIDIEAQSLIGTQRICAYQADFVIAERLVSFVEASFSTEYLSPTEPERWLIEDIQVHLVVYGTAPKNEDLASVPITRLPFSNVTYDPRLAKDDSSTQNLVLELASISENRRGIPENKIVELMSSRLKLTGSLRWNVLRAWVEAGYLDVLTDARWRSRVYFAIQPRLTLTRSTNGLTASLTGLVPRFVSQRFEEVCRLSGFTSSSKGNDSRFVPSMYQCAVPDMATATLVASELEIGEPVIAQPITFDVGTIIELASANRVTASDNWPFFMAWDWSSRYFRESARLKELNGISLSWCRREDGPDRYKAFRDGSPILSTRSRVWAILSAYAFAGISPFELAGLTELVGSGDSSHLPLPLARAIAICGPQLPGPVDGRPIYRYVFPTHRIRQNILATLGFTSHTPTLRPAELQRLEVLLQRSGGTMQFLPESLRRDLIELAGCSDATIARLVSQSALPEIYAFARALTQRRSN
jgi:hypothetical protein